MPLQGNGNDETRGDDEDEIIRDNEDEDDYGTLGGNGGELDICLTNTGAHASYSGGAEGVGQANQDNVAVFPQPIRV